MERAFLIGPADVIAAADLAALAEPTCETFRSEQELTAVTKNWPLRRLVELWNRLPAVVPVRRFENRSIAIGRIWRAILSDGSQASPRSNGKPPKQPRPPREGSKAAVVVNLLSRPQGATLQEIMDATQWQPHSVRGFLSGNLGKKRKLKVRLVQQDGRRSYRLPRRRSEPLSA